MQATHSLPPAGAGSNLLRNLSWFLAVPVLFLVVVGVALALTVSAYEARHIERVYTGVSMWGVDLSQMNRAEARRALAGLEPVALSAGINVREPASGQTWWLMLQEVGMSLDVDASVDAALRVGRDAGPAADLAEQFYTWYFGKQMAPVIVVDEARLQAAVERVAATVERPAIDATLAYDGNAVAYTPSQVGRAVDRADLRAQLLTAVATLQGGEIELLTTALRPRTVDTSATAEAIRQMSGSPMALFIQMPLADDDLVRVTVPRERLTEWLRIAVVTGPDGATSHDVSIDENAVRNWLLQYESQLYREPVNARFYFDDNTRELVVVAPHVNGRQLNVEATVQQFMAQVGTPNRTLPFVMDDVLPVVHGGATAAELGITELVSEATTWFAGSAPERKHNIARAASKFYGIVVAPGQTFSFNEYLGEISEEEYETGLIIVGGRTIEGVGGGVCQVSTTMFQAVFWGGFPVEERWAHGYRVGYYEAGEGPGMDATVYSPIVDLRFTNNTPYHLLIENYYNETFESLWFKFYSTSMGRTVQKGGPIVENVRPAKPDVWEFNPELEEDEIEQVDWAAEGSDVTVRRQVFNRDGQLILEDTFVSYYIPWQNIYQYGSGVRPPTPAPTPTSTPETTPEP